MKMPIANAAVANGRMLELEKPHEGGLRRNFDSHEVSIERVIVRGQLKRSPRTLARCTLDYRPGHWIERQQFS
jgi:hypothetical protein